MSIRNRLRWSYLVSSTLPLLLVGILLVGLTFQMQRENAFTSQQALADQLAGNIATFIFDLEQQLLRSSRQLDPSQTVEQLNGAVRELAASNPDLRALRVYANDGRVLAGASNPLIAMTTDPQTESDRALIERTLRSGFGGRSDIRTSSDEQTHFQLALPLRDPQTNGLVGALSAEVSTTRIEQILSGLRRQQGVVAYLINGDQQVLLTDGTAGWLPAPSLMALFSGERSVAIYNDGNDEEVIGARAAISLSTWQIVVEQPSRQIFADVYRSLFLLSTLVMVVGALGLGWGLLQARMITRPLRALNAGAQALGTGRLDYRIDVMRDDEIGQVARTFNIMADQLQHSLRAIEQQNQELRDGLTLAREIQMGLLPQQAPWAEEQLLVAAQAIPAHEVGGDFYTYITQANGAGLVAIGDISGKGVAAALLMALTSSNVEAQAVSSNRPAAMLDALNETLGPRMRANRMNAALLIAAFDPQQSLLCVANAGMIAPLLIRRSSADDQPVERLSAEYLDVGGLPIGHQLGGSYAEAEIVLEPGDTLLFVSDGIVEAHNSARELFGFERLHAVITSLPLQSTPTIIVNEVISATLAFVNGATQHDDITVIAVQPSFLATTAARAEAAEYSFGTVENAAFLLFSHEVHEDYEARCVWACSGRCVISALSAPFLVPWFCRILNPDPLPMRGHPGTSARFVPQGCTARPPLVAGRWS
ncbi:SpoIIE family protein phosphatase [Candidatus Gracilibacteria bacterium]|nr:SpoIIE family protein phosphatase [Candidatus Gracilibacteria bacterium]